MPGKSGRVSSARACMRATGTNLGNTTRLAQTSVTPQGGIISLSSPERGLGWPRIWRKIRGPTHGGGLMVPVHGMPRHPYPHSTQSLHS